MGLKTLISNLEAGSPFGAGFPNHSTPEAYNYGESTSIFDTNIPSNRNDYFPFRQRSMGYGPKGIDIGTGAFFRGTSPEPFLKQQLPGLNTSQGSGVFDVIDDVSDSFVRGGLITAGKRALKDTERIGRFLISGNGLAFIAKNVGMQRMNPKLQEGAGFLGRNRVYNAGVNTLAQTLTSFTGLHVNRAGLLPIGKANYRVEQGYRVDINNDTKYEFNVRGGDSDTGVLGGNPLPGGTGNLTTKKNVYKGNRLASLYNKLVNPNLNPAGINSGGNGELYEYGGGPHSVYGIGKTRLKRYNFTNRDSFLNTDYIKKDPTNYISSRHLGQIGGKKQGLLNELIDFRKSKGTAFTDYQAKESKGSGRPLLDRRGFPILTQQRNSTSLKQSYSEASKGPQFPNIPAFEDGRINYTQRDTSGEDPEEFYKPTQFYWVGDKINRMPIIRSTPGSKKDILQTEAHKGIRDYIDFFIESVNVDDPEETDTIVFRAFLESLDDDYAAKWNEFRYNGRSEPFYNYGNFKRSINFSFKIAASSRTEMKPLYMKLNYLLTQTAGDYSRTRLRGNLNRLTIGDYLQRVPGVFTNIKLKWSKEYPWEIAEGRMMSRKDDNGKPIDIDQYQLPHILDVSCNYLPIHDFIPRKSISNSPFIGPVENLAGGVYVGEINPWYGSQGEGKDSLRNDRDDKEQLAEEEAAAQEEFNTDMAEMAAMEQEERDRQAEEDRLARIAQYEAEEDAERDANEKAGLGRKTNYEVQQDEELEAMYDDLEEEEDVEWDIGEQGPMNYDQDGSGNPPPTPPMV